MKIRNGFVSNSSSSSFIIGVGKIKANKLEELQKEIESIKDEIEYNDDVEIANLKELKEKNSYNFRLHEKYIEVAAQINWEPSVSIKIDSIEDEGKFLVVNVGNDEGDGMFWNEDTDELNYDIVTEDFFVGYQKKLLDILKNKEYFEDVEYNIGAGRNG
jgi:hypothetical protein